MAHALCMMNILGYKHTLRICDTYCFSTATMVARTSLKVTLYVHFLSCFTKLSYGWIKSSRCFLAFYITRVYDRLKKFWYSFLLFNTSLYHWIDKFWSLSC